MTSFLTLSSVLGVVMAFFGFYSSVSLDLPLGPTDVALGCCLIFLAYGFRRLSAKTTVTLLIVVCIVISITSCGNTIPTAPVPEAKSIDYDRIWLAQVKNSTGLPLLLPSRNPLRSLAEMAGKISSDYRQSVVDLLRDNLRKDLEQNGFRVMLPEEMDNRFPPLTADSNGAVRVAREGNLSGLIFVSEIWRWDGEPQKYVRVLADFKILRVDDGIVVWQKRVQRAVPTPSAPYLGQAYIDAIKIVVHDLFT
jgi:hypothetical protein